MEHYRAIIYFHYKVGEKATQCHTQLVKAFGVSAPSIDMVHKWYRLFQSGRRSLEDHLRSGRHRTAVTIENIDAVRTMIAEDNRLTYEEIELKLNIGTAAAYEILHVHLNLKKVQLRWVPHTVTPAQKLCRVNWCKKMLRVYSKGRDKRVFYIVTGDETWIYFYDPPLPQQNSVWVEVSESAPGSTAGDRSSFKRIFAFFLRKSGFVASVMVPEGKTVTAEWYVRSCLPKVFRNIKKERPQSGLTGIELHHDNARPHTAQKTVSFLEQKRVKLVGHPPYSPDLAIMDFFFNPVVKIPLKGHRFTAKRSC